jgi:caa(3)-type oxidase subunit IV
MVLVWFALLAITALEVALAYFHVFSTGVMLLILMALSFVKAGLIVAYFMHIKFERMSLALSLFPATLLLIAALFAFFPDSYRILQLGGGS